MQVRYQAALRPERVNYSNKMDLKSLLLCVESCRESRKPAPHLAHSSKEWRSTGSKFRDIISRRGNEKETRTSGLFSPRFTRDQKRQKTMRYCARFPLHPPELLQSQDRSSATTSLISLLNRDISSGGTDSAEAATAGVISSAAGPRRLRAP
jgi:hypothetical protein